MTGNPFISDEITEALAAAHENPTTDQPVAGVAEPFRRVIDAMVTRPKILAESDSVGDVRAMFLNDHVHMVLVVAADGTLITTIERDDLDTSLREHAPASTLGTLAGRTIHPGTFLSEALSLMQRSRRRRLAVVDDRGALIGILCLKRSGTGFCSDDDVRARSETPRRSDLSA